MAKVREFTKMMSVKLAAHVLVAAAVSVSCATIAQAQAQNGTASMWLNNAVQAIQTPQLAASGIAYQQSGTTSTLTAYTEGFLFCANVPAPLVQTVKFTAAHEDQTLPTTHPWVFPTVSDVQSIGYSGGALNINRNASGSIMTSLVCNSTAANGSVPSGLADGIFDDRFDGNTVANYSHLVNWTPPPGFDWNAPDWMQVPADGCDSAAPHVLEDIACAAVTGYTPAVTGAASRPAGRAALMWTAFDQSGLNFTYLFRFDGKSISQPAKVLITDAFEGGSSGMVDGFLSRNGKYCLLFPGQLPTTLDSNACNAVGAQTFTGNLSVPRSLAATGGGEGVDQTFYVAVTRPVVGGHPSLTTPVVAASVSMDPTVSTFGGDRFTGDDVVFGFMPTSGGFVAQHAGPAGFEWMHPAQ